MLLVVASRVDEVARRLASEFPGEAALLTSVDLSQPGWALRPGTAADSTFVAGGCKHESGVVTGVVCLLPCIFERELVDIHRDDRSYVAAEMTAFLIYWLSSLDCPKLNPPTAGCLSGPIWRPEHWVVTAAAAGLPVEPLRRSTWDEEDGGGRTGSGAEGSASGGVAGSDKEPDLERATVTVVGRQCLGHADDELQRQAQTLASAAEVGLLDVDFVRAGGGFRFCGADPFPDLSQAGAFEAVAEFFDAAGRQKGAGGFAGADGSDAAGGPGEGSDR